MFELQNFTCFHTQQFKNIDQTDRAYDVVVAKVSYEFEIDPETGKTKLSFARKQTPLTFADTYYGDPSQTSTQFESDFSLYKPKTDLVVNATAYAPDDVPSRQFTVSVSIGDYQKSLALTGERYWVREGGGASAGFIRDCTGSVRNRRCLRRGGALNPGPGRGAGRPLRPSPR